MSNPTALGAGLEWQPMAGGRMARLMVPTAGETGFTRMTGQQTGIQFTNALDDRRVMENNNFMLGAGVALGDFDGDSWCDVYFCAINGTNALYRNLGQWNFEDVTARAGVGAAGWHSTGAVFADIDGDGDLDLLVNTLGRGTHCFLNLGDGRFREVTERAGLQSSTGSTSFALGDIDGDGDLDLYVANYGALAILRAGGRADMKRVNGQWQLTGPYADRLRFVEGRLEEVGEPDVLYWNDGQGRFKPVPWNSEWFRDEQGQSKPAPWDFGLCVQMRDVNEDGFPDLYVCNDFQTVDRLWINDGTGHFRLLPRLAMRQQSFASMGVDFADLDRDGHLDFFVVEMLSREHARRMRQIGGMPPLVPLPGRIDNRPEVTRNTLFWNRGDGTYAEIANFSGVEASEWSWSPVFLDVDLDGFEDILVPNGNAFDVQDRDALAQVRALGRQTPEQTRTNLLLYPRLDTPNAAFRNRGDLTFEEVGRAWGFDSRQISQGIALADLDHDGDLDVAVNCLYSAPLLYRNDSTAPRVAVRLRGRTPNVQGIGARIRLFGGAVPVQSQEIVCGGRYLSGDDPMRVFAAGSLTNRLTLEVAWRSGARSVVHDVQPNRLYEIDESGAKAASNSKFETPEAIGGVDSRSEFSPLTPALSPLRGEGDPKDAGPAPSPLNGERAGVRGEAVRRREPSPSSAIASPSSKLPLFTDASSLLDHTHHEELFDDYARQPLLWKQLSSLGPGVAWFDLDGDGHDELFLGAGKGGLVEMFRGDGRGQFTRITPTNAARLPDDVTGLAGFVMANRRRVLLTGIAAYENPGHGAAVGAVQWDPATGQIMHGPVRDIASMEGSTGPLAVADYDGDGDLDLFVGGRFRPGAYPERATSRLHRQQEARLALDPAIQPVLEKIGLVSGAVWSDLDGDSFPELVLACEWGPLRIFRNEQGKLTAWDPPVERKRENGKTGKREDDAVLLSRFPAFPLSSLTGWWNSVATGDLDGDGRLDLIVGNWGLNSPYHATEAQPVRLYYGDLGGRGVVDLVEAYFAPELQAIVPRRSLAVLSQAMPSLAEHFPTHRAYGIAPVSELFQRPEVQPAEVQATTLASMVFFNRGDHFEAVPLPREAQWAPAFSVNVADFDGDGHEDVFLSQNFFATRPEMPRLDAGRGLLLRGNGTGKLEAMSGQQSGIAVYGEQRGAAVSDFDADGRADLVVTQNGAATKLFHNVGAKPGMRIRLVGPPGNPDGVGSTLRLKFASGMGPAREIHAGSGYWSQDGVVQVLGARAPPTHVWVRWPGGQISTVAVPAGATEITVTNSGSGAQP
jgi:hypothetical protein